MTNRDREEQARTRRTIGVEGEKVPFEWTRKNIRPARICKWTGESSATNRLSQIVPLLGRFRGHDAIVLKIVTHGGDHRDFFTRDFLRHTWLSIECFFFFFFFFNNYQISRRNGFLINNATGIWDYIVMMIGDLFAEEWILTPSSNFFRKENLKELKIFLEVEWKKFKSDFERLRKVSANFIIDCEPRFAQYANSRAINDRFIFNK